MKTYGDYGSSILKQYQRYTIPLESQTQDRSNNNHCFNSFYKGDEPDSDSKEKIRTHVGEWKTTDKQVTTRFYFDLNI